MERVERPEAAQVEDRPEVDEERIVARAGEDQPIATEVGDTHRRVVDRVRARADVRRRHAQNLVRCRLGRADPRDLLDRVRLLDVQVRVVLERDRTRVVEERVRVRDGRLEPEAIRDVVASIPVVVDVDLVPGCRIEPVVVRPTCRILERDEVRDDRDGVRIVRAHERIQVRVVDRRVVRDQRRFPVARRGCARWADPADERGRRHRRRRRPRRARGAALPSSCVLLSQGTRRPGSAGLSGPVR